MPDDYAALVLIGGFGWTTPVAEQVVPIVQQAIEKGKIVGAICNGASFMFTGKQAKALLVELIVHFDAFRRFVFKQQKQFFGKFKRCRDRGLFFIRV